MDKNSRRVFLKHSGVGAIGLGLFGISGCSNVESNDAKTKVVVPKFKISLAQWSLHRTHRDGSMNALDFAKVAKQEFGLEAIEYVNQFFKDKAKDSKYIAALKNVADSEGVQSLLIMIDGEGQLGASDTNVRQLAVENHFAWVEAAKKLGCHSIRVNAAGEGNAEEVAKAAVDGLSALANFAKDFDINVIVENHGSHSSNGKWLSDIMRQINLPNCGTLPDFGNFCIERDDAKLWKDKKCIDEYDRYLGMQELMPFAKAVSAKSMDFDNEGNVVETDYYRMMDIVLAAGYSGYVGVEYEGFNLSEKEGIKKTIELLRKIQIQS